MEINLRGTEVFLEINLRGTELFVFLHLKMREIWIILFLSEKSIENFFSGSMKVKGKRPCWLKGRDVSANQLL